MKWLLVGLLAAFLVYLIYDTFIGKHTPILSTNNRSKRLCDYYASGSVFEDIPTAIKRGIRLLEVHVYSDERDQPVVSKLPQNSGYDFANDNVSFEQVCVDIVNDAFPSKDPFILSIVLHTNKSITANKVAEHLLTTVRRHLISEKDLQDVPMDQLENKLILIGSARGTELDSLFNMTWDDSGVRRLSYNQAVHSRDPEELKEFNRDFITIVGPDSELKTPNANPKTPLALGCQWNLYNSEPPGFWEKPEGLQ